MCEPALLAEQPSAKCRTVLADVAAPGKRVTVEADKVYDTKGFVKACRTIKVTPHVAQNTKRKGGSAIGARTPQHPAYEVSQRKRKRIEQRFGSEQGDRPDPPSHGSGTGQSRSASDADDGGRQPHAAAYLGAPAPAVHPMRAKDVEMVGSDLMYGLATGVLGAIGRFQNAA